MQDFAKLFHAPDIGQVLVMLTTSEDGEYPEIRVCFKPKDLGICTIKLGFTDINGDIAQTKAERAFTNFTEEKALELVRSSIVNAVSPLLASQEKGEHDV